MQLDIEVSLCANDLQMGNLQIAKAIKVTGTPKTRILLGMKVYIEFWWSEELFSSLNFSEVTDGQTESDAYEPTVQFAQVGSMNIKYTNPAKGILDFCKQNFLLGIYDGNMLMGSNWLTDWQTDWQSVIQTISLGSN